MHRHCCAGRTTTAAAGVIGRGVAAATARAVACIRAAAKLRRQVATSRGSDHGSQLRPSAGAITTRGSVWSVIRATARSWRRAQHVCNSSICIGHLRGRHELHTKNF